MIFEDIPPSIADFLDQGAFGRYAFIHVVQGDPVQIFFNEYLAY